MPRKAKSWYRVSLVRETIADPRPVIRAPHHALPAILPSILPDKEAFGVLLLDTRHRVLAVLVISVGSLSASVVHPREVFRPILLNPDPVASVILFHNHPSNDTCPSEDDIEITRRLVSVGELVGVEVLDHMILTSNGNGQFFSFREGGLI
jgi:DNA repair protein RadC